MTTRVPFVDLAAQQASLQPELGLAIERALASGQYILGENVAAFEREMAKFCGAQYAIGVANGTDALVLALRALGIESSDPRSDGRHEIVTTPFTFIATATAIQAVGAKIVFADIDAASFNIDPDQIVRRLTRRTRAILPVHLFGQPAAMDAILALARKRRLAVVEDAAQAIGAKYHDRCVGTFGNAGILSFYPTKNLGAAGDGGAVLTNSQRVADAVRLLRAHGARHRYVYERRGMNSRLDELQAAILLVKLRRLAAWNTRRRTIAAWYRRELASLGDVVIPPKEIEGSEHVYHVFTVRVAARVRNRLLQHLVSRGIGAAVFYPKPLHLQKVFRQLGYRTGDFPVSERVAREVLALPIYPELSDLQLETVITTIRKFFRR